MRTVVCFCTFLRSFHIDFVSTLKCCNLLFKTCHLPLEVLNASRLVYYFEVRAEWMSIMRYFRMLLAFLAAMRSWFRKKLIFLYYLVSYAPLSDVREAAW